MREERKGGEMKGGMDEVRTEGRWVGSVRAGGV